MLSRKQGGVISLSTIAIIIILQIIGCSIPASKRDTNDWFNETVPGTYLTALTFYGTSASWDLNDQNQIVNTNRGVGLSLIQRDSLVIYPDQSYEVYYEGEVYNYGDEITKQMSIDDDILSTKGLKWSGLVLYQRYKSRAWESKYDELSRQGFNDGAIRQIIGNRPPENRIPEERRVYYLYKRGTTPDPDEVKDILAYYQISLVQSNKDSSIQLSDTITSSSYIETVPSGSMDILENVTDESTVTRVATVTDERAYFHTEPDENTQRRAYVIKGQKVNVTSENDRFLFCTYESGKTVTAGYILKSAVDFE